jgi:hypothetical protein
VYTTSELMFGLHRNCVSSDMNGEWRGCGQDYWPVLEIACQDENLRPLRTLTIVFVFCNPLHNDVTNSGEKGGGGNKNDSHITSPWCHDEDKQQCAVYTLATKTQKGYGHLSKTQELNFKTLYFVNTKSFQGQDTLLRKLCVRVTLPAWYEFAVCNWDAASEFLFDFNRSPKLMLLLEWSFVTHSQPRLVNHKPTGKTYRRCTTEYY